MHSGAYTASCVPYGTLPELVRDSTFEVSGGWQPAAVSARKRSADTERRRAILKLRQ